MDFVRNRLSNALRFGLQLFMAQNKNDEHIWALPQHPKDFIDLYILNAHSPKLLILPILVIVGPVLIFQFSPGFGTEALIPVVLRFRFRYLGCGAYPQYLHFGTKISRDF